MTLTRPQQMLLEAISAAIRGEQTAWAEEIPTADWQAFFQLAMDNHVLPLVYEAVYVCKAAKAEPIVMQYKQMALRQVIVQTVKTNEFLPLYDALWKQRLHPLIVKGILCRSLYPNGDYRSSSDEDLLIPEGEWDACCHALRESGMGPVDERNLQQYEAGWRKGPLYIELHRSLFSPESDACEALNGFFAQAHMQKAEYTVDGDQYVWSLTPHDHLLYLILHAYKHFIYSGFGIRQVCDIGLWAVHYGREVDWGHLYEQCEAAHARLFAAAVFRLAQTSLHLAVELPQQWRDVEVDPEPMLQDLLSGGVYGGRRPDRIHSASVTVNAVAASRTGRQSHILSSVFPPKERLLRQYPELREHPGHLPVVWMKRLTKYAKETRKLDHNRTRDTLRIARERTELLRLYEILE